MNKHVKLNFKNEIFAIDDGGVKHAGAATLNDHKNEGLC